jgi:hypothetical protein
MIQGSSKTIGALALVCFSLNAGSAVPQDESASHDESVLEANMELVEDGMKALRRSVRSPEGWPASLATVAELQQAILTCKTEVPIMAASRPEAERPAFVAAYRKEMATMLRTMTELEIALLDGDEEAIQALYKTIRAMEDDGHDRFTEEE